MLALNYIVLAVGLSITAAIFSFAFKLYRLDRVEAKKGAARVSSISDAIMGRARTRDDWLPDGRIKGGMIYNRRAKRIEVCGRLSDEAYNRIFR